LFCLLLEIGWSFSLPSSLFGRVHIKNINILRQKKKKENGILDTEEKQQNIQAAASGSSGWN
jgi:hypothetical protein